MKPLRSLLMVFSMAVLATPAAVSAQSAVLGGDAGPHPAGFASDLRAEAARPISMTLLEVPEIAPIAEPALLLPQARARNRRGVPLMVAGGILFVAGAIAGDDVGTILMLGGAGVGAWGAYVYFGG